MATQDPLNASDTSDSTSDYEATTARIQDELVTRFRPFLSMFGSVAAVSAFLLFAGFLSDFGAYRLVGLPRLSFSFTALVETGADVAVDMLSLLAQGTRACWLVLLLASVITVWSLHRSQRLQPLASSRRLYRLARLTLLILSFAVFASLVDRTQRSLAGEMHTAAAVERALQEAYKNGFPDPHERQRAIDKEGYALRFFRLPNLAVGMETAWQRAKRWLPLADGERLDDETGLVLRPLPESRRDARHVFGWLALSVVTLSLLAVLCQWWGRSQQDAQEVYRPPGRWLLRWLDGDLTPAIDRIVAPLTILLLSVSILLLPLAHGVLAKRSLGGEHVMVYLKHPGNVSEESTVKRTDGGTESSLRRGLPLVHPEPTELRWPGARFDCTRENEEELRRIELKHNVSLQNLVEERESEANEYSPVFAGYLRSLDKVAAAVIEANCADAVRRFWALKPSPGLAGQLPNVANSYRQAATRVAVAYGLRIGTILTYPRDTQPLTLVDSIVPRSVMQNPVWSLQAIDAQQVAESVVLPDLYRRGAQQVSDIVRFDPGNAALEQLLQATSSEMLEVVLPLLKNGRLFADGRAVAITSLGSMAWVSAAERPRLSAEALRLLADVAGPQPTAFWPDKDERARGAAATALHLSRSPYAAHLLAERVASGLASCSAPAGSDTHRSLACVPQSSTAAGYLLQDLRAEAARFHDQDSVPASLQEARQTLETFLAQLITGENVSDDVRGAACSAISLAGGIQIAEPQLRQALLQALSPAGLRKRPISAAMCLNRAHRVGLEPSAVRQLLRGTILNDVPEWKGATPMLLRVAAFESLNQMGLSGEVNLIGHLLLNENDNELAEMVPFALNQLDVGQLTRFLRDCARSSSRPVPERVRCLNAFEHAHESADGDDGSIQDIVTLAGSSDTRTAEAACGVLRLFEERRGVTVRLLNKNGDQTVRHCLKERTETPPDNEEAVRKLLDQWRKRPVSEGDTGPKDMRSQLAGVSP